MVMKSSHSRNRHYFRRGEWPRRNRAFFRRVLIQSQVAAVLMVVADVGPHEPEQMTFAKDHDMLVEFRKKATLIDLNGAGETTQRPQ